MEAGLDEEDARRAAGRLFSDKAAGNVLRVKGFVPAPGDGEYPWRQINITRKEEEVRPAKTGQEILIVTGEKLDEARVRGTLKGECHAVP